MSSAVEMACPSCEKTLKVPPAVFGKKIKCKHCGHAFVVQDPDVKPAAKPTKPTKPGAKPAAASPPPPPETKKKSDWDDDEDSHQIEVIKEDEVPRCPHCAKELDPPDAIVCIHCGFNNRTRSQAETKRVWAPEPMDWINHLLPGIIALVIVIGLVVFHIISILNMRDWLDGSFLESDDDSNEKDPKDPKKYRKKLYVAPGAFIFFLIAISIPILIPAAKFAFRRLVKEYRPVEQVKK